MPNFVQRDALEYLDAHVIAVVATLLPDGAPYASAAHYARADGEALLCFSLDRRSTTAENMRRDPRAAVTVGTDPEIPETLQMRGSMFILSGADLVAARARFYDRFPHSERFREDCETVFAGFSPKWLRLATPKTDGRHLDFFKRGFAPELLR